MFKYLSADEYSPLKYYEILNEEEFSGLGRDEFIEVLVTPRFSKMKELSDTVKKISSLAEMFETITQQSLCGFPAIFPQHGQCGLVRVEYLVREQFT
ncbi:MULTISPECIES: hypothetical protein, partial [unclassified Neglectibacter]|uniref:hypothetical protein n=1 Tax=unclassified Neglectibacter TaxID=2632164 RepID=UPI00136AA82A